MRRFTRGEGKLETRDKGKSEGRIRKIRKEGKKVREIRKAGERKMKNETCKRGRAREENKKK